MLTALSLFDLSDFPHTNLFTKKDYPWAPLNNLKEYLDKYDYPVYDSQVIKDAVPLNEHIVIYETRLFLPGTVK